MTNMISNKQKNRQRRILYRKLHRWTGLSLILFVIFMVFSGILLNHTAGLKLDSHYVKAGWVLDWYGIKPDFETTQYFVEPEYITKIGDRLYLNQKMIGKDKDINNTPLVGAVKTGNFIVAGLSDKILLLTLEGELVETINAYQGLPAPIEKLGLTKSAGLLLATRDGNFKFDLNELKSRRVQRVSQKWAEPSKLPVNLKHTLLTSHRESSLSWERVVQDLHSGRLFGNWGVYVVDFFAILFLVLSLTGFLLWFINRTRKPLQ